MDYTKQIPLYQQPLLLTKIQIQLVHMLKVNGI